MRHLYVKRACPGEPPEPAGDFLKACRVEVLRPGFLRLTRPGEKLNLKGKLGRLLFRLMAGKAYGIFYLYHGSHIVHTSYVVPKCIKFPFLKVGEWELGPCVTVEKYRRNGIYRYMLAYITSLPEFAGADFYMIIRKDNAASIGGAEKAGFTRCGSVRKTKLLTYELEK